ncbi:MAG: hypothetical protein R2706_11620 [Acidimicrobiales bacterium]
MSRQRYLLVAVGFLGVVLVVRPTPERVLTLDVARGCCGSGNRGPRVRHEQVTADTPPLPIALLTSLCITSMMGVISLATGWGDLTVKAVVALVLACFCLIAGYLFAIETVRVGDLSVSPFRYTSVIGAVGVGLVFFDETPDALTITGCV